MTSAIDEITLEITLLPLLTLPLYFGLVDCDHDIDIRGTASHTLPPRTLVRRLSALPARPCDVRRDRETPTESRELQERRIEGQKGQNPELGRILLTFFEIA